MNTRLCLSNSLRTAALALLVAGIHLPLQAALVNQYTFNDGAVTDTVGGLNGTLEGTASVDFTGLLQLTGGGAGNSYANLPNGIASTAAAGGTAGAFSFEVWAAANANADWASLVSLGGATGQEDNNEGPAKDYFQLIPQSGAAGTIRATTHAINNGTEGFVDFSAPLSTQNEQHLVFVIDQSGGLPGTLDFYVDGNHVGQAEVATGLDATTMVDNNNWLGRSQWGDASFNGSYNEFRVYDHALSAGEVTTSYDAGPTLPDLLSLIVNTNTGIASLRNNASVPIDFSYYKIASEMGALDASPFANGSGWNSLSDQNVGPVDGNDADSIPGSRDTETWEEAGGSDANGLFELFVEGSSLLQPGESLTLGAPFDTSVFGLGNEADLEFFFGLSGGGALIQSSVHYVTSSDPGDFDGDGDVDGRDFIQWQKGNSNSSLSAADLAAWEANYGNGVAPLAAASVPEPSALALLAMSGLLLAGSRRGSTRVACLLIGLTVVSCMSDVSSAAVTNDRVYSFGEGDVSPGVGNIVGSGLLAPDPTTLDSAGTSGTGNIQPLFAQNASSGGNDPRYVSPANSNLPASTLAAEFDGNDYIFGRRLGLPSTSDPAVGLPGDGDDTDGLAPEDYSNIDNRGFQLWVKPGATGSRQSVVMDTNQHGLQITPGGTWSMRYNGNDFDSGVNASVGQWAHVMVVRPTGAGAQIYVNGVAVAAAAGGYDGADNARLVIGANTSDDNGMIGMSDFFTGVVDQLEMFVMGVNGGDPATDYGTFDVSTDNAAIAAALAGKPQGDINLDGSVGPADVSRFVSNWLTTPKRLNNAAIADLDSYRAGDLNFNGIVDLDDAFILHEGLQLAGSAGLNFELLTGGTIPEPGTASLFVFGVASAAMLRGRTRKVC